MIRLPNAETDLLFVMQFGLMKKGKERLCVEHHSSRLAMMEGYDDKFILQKNFVKSNGKRAVKARNYHLITGRKPKLIDWSWSSAFVDGFATSSKWLFDKKKASRFNFFVGLRMKNAVSIL